MIPKDEVLEEALLREMGWKDIAYYRLTGSANPDGSWKRERLVKLCSPDSIADTLSFAPDNVLEPDGTERRIPCRERPRLCSDERTKPQIWQLINDGSKEREYIEELNKLLPLRMHIWNHCFQIHTTSPRLCVEAALKTLGVWKPEWDAPEEVEMVEVPDNYEGLTSFNRMGI